MKKKTIIALFSKIIILGIALTVLLIRWFGEYRQPIEQFKLSYQSSNAIWFKIQADMITMQYFKEVIIVSATLFIAFFLLDLFLTDAKESKKRNLIVMAAVAVVSLIVVIIFDFVFDNEFMLANFYYLGIAQILIASGAYAFTRHKPRMKAQTADGNSLSKKDDCGAKVNKGT